MSIDYLITEVKPRQNLLDLFSQKTRDRIMSGLAVEPKKWITELSYIRESLSNTSIGALGRYSFEGTTPPDKDPDFKKIGDNIYLYTGDCLNMSGLWIYEEELDFGNFSSEPVNKLFWKNYRLTNRAKIGVNPEFSIDARLLDPRNFLEDATPVAKEKGMKRPIYTINIGDSDNPIMVYAKGGQFSTSYYTEIPPWRILEIAGFSKTFADNEIRFTERVAEFGINAPRIIGLYRSETEDYNFFTEVPGESPDKFIPDRKQDIIVQDARMLARLCRAGYRKQGFADFDDKKFDGEKLSLIDVDEVQSIRIRANHFDTSADYAYITTLLSDPCSRGGLKEFRAMQRRLFLAELSDAVFTSREKLLFSEEDVTLYVAAFFNELHWKAPSKKFINSLLTQTNHYSTLDSALAVD